MMEDASALVFGAERMASPAVPGNRNLQIFDGSLYMSPPNGIPLQMDGSLYLSPSPPRLELSGVAEADLVVGTAVAHPFDLGAGRFDFGQRSAPLARVAPTAPPRKCDFHHGASPSSPTDCLRPSRTHSGSLACSALASLGRPHNAR